MTHGKAMDVKAATDREPSDSAGCEGERALCVAVIKQAVADLTNYSATQGERDSAERFIFDGDSNLSWMAAALALDLDAVREGVRERMREAARKQQQAEPVACSAGDVA